MAKKATREIVLTFERTNIYRAELSGPELTKLAKHLGITGKQLSALLAEETLLDEHEEEVISFLIDNGELVTMAEEGNIESLECEYIDG